MFKKYRQMLFSRRHHAIVDESELIDAIKIINSSTKVEDVDNTYVRNAGWENRPECYYVAFTCYNREWEALKKKLMSTTKSIEILD